MKIMNTILGMALIGCGGTSPLDSGTPDSGYNYLEDFNGRHYGGWIPERWISVTEPSYCGEEQCPANSGEGNSAWCLNSTVGRFERAFPAVEGYTSEVYEVDVWWPVPTSATENAVRVSVGQLDDPMGPWLYTFGFSNTTSCTDCVAVFRTERSVTNFTYRRTNTPIHIRLEIDRTALTYTAYVNGAVIVRGVGLTAFAERMVVESTSPQAQCYETLQVDNVHVQYR